MSDAPKKLSLVAQLEEVDFELDMRRRVYPGQVKRGGMRESVANEHIRRMEAVRATLAWLQENETKIKEALSK
jgi:hypothetical protein